MRFDEFEGTATRRRRRHRSRLILNYIPGMSLAQMGATFTNPTPNGVRSYVDANSLEQFVNTDVARDGHYINGVRSLLLEGPRTDSCLQSRNFNATWVKTAGTTVAYNAVGIDGVANTAATITMAGISDNIQMQGLSAALAGQVTTFSVWLKGSGSIYIGLFDNIAGGQQVQVVLTATLTRYSITRTIGVGATDIRAQITRLNDVATTTTVIADGSQVEVGASASSFIPTTAAAVTRSADNIAFVVSDTPQPVTVYGKLVVGAVSPAAGIYPIFQRGGVGNAGVRLNAFFDTAGNKLRVDYNDGIGAAATAVDSQAFAAGDVMEFAVSLNPNGKVSVATAKNGAAFVAATISAVAATFPAAYAGNAFNLGGLGAAVSSFNAYQSLKYAAGVRPGSDMRLAS